MFLRIYKINHPVIILLIFLLSGLIWSLAFFNASFYEFPELNFEMPFYYWIYNWVSPYPFIARIISYILILIQASLLNRLNNRYFLLESRTYLPSLLFILMCSIFPLQNLHPIIFSNLFLLIGIDKIFGTYRNDDKWSNYFDTGILISIASLFYIKYFFVIVIVWISLFTLRPFRGREWLLTIVGFLLPYIFVLSYFFVFEENVNYKMNIYFNQLFNFNNIFYYNYVYYAYLIILIILTAVSSFKILATLRKQKVSVRRFFHVFFWLFLISIVLFAISSFSKPSFLSIAAISLSFLFSNYFLNVKSVFWREVIFTIILAIAVLFQLYYYTDMLKF